MKLRLFALFCALTAVVAWSEEPPAIQDAVKTGFQKDVVYGKAGDVDLKLDLSVPQNGDGPFPCIVCIHGGAWRAGDKSQYDGAIRALAQIGYVAATVEYRFCPKYKFPAQIEDCKCAVRFLRQHAKELKLDPNRIGATGDSAGGHLSLMLGLMDAKDGLEGDGGSQKESSKVQAVVNNYGPTDFTVTTNVSPVTMQLISDFLGTVDHASPEAAKASPITYVDKNDPPILSFHGTVDPLVPLDQAKRLHEALKKAGVNEKLEIIEGAGHGFGGKDGDRVRKETVEFFDKYLKGQK